MENNGTRLILAWDGGVEGAEGVIIYWLTDFTDFTDFVFGNAYGLIIWGLECNGEFEGLD